MEYRGKYLIRLVRYREPWENSIVDGEGGVLAGVNRQRERMAPRCLDAKGLQSQIGI